MGWDTKAGVSVKGRLLAVLLVLLGGSSYGFVAMVVKLAYADQFRPEELTDAQFIISVCILLVLTVLRRETFRNLTRKDLLQLTMLGLISAGTSIFYYESLHYLPASFAIVLLFQFTWIVMVLDYFILKQKPTRKKWLALVCIFIGTLLAVDLFHTDWHMISLAGIILGLLSAFTYAVFLYGTSFVSTRTGPFARSTILNIVSLIIVCIIFPPAFLWSGAFSAGLWKWALAIGILSQTIPPLCFNIGIPVIGGSVAGVLGAIELPVSVVSSFFILGEHVDVLQWIGVFSILIGIVVSEYKQLPKIRNVQKVPE